MIVLSLLLLAAQQSADEYRCGGSGDVVNCENSQGATYIERRLGDRVLRQGTDLNGRTWREYVVQEVNGIRTIGEDDRGRTWGYRCSPDLGTVGTGRNGEPFSIPPQPRPSPGKDALGHPLPPSDPCR